MSPPDEPTPEHPLGQPSPGSEVPVPDTATPNESSTAPKGPQHAAAKKRRRFWPRRRWVQVVTIVAIVVVLLLAALAGYAYYQANRINHVDVNGLTAETSSGAGKGTENILMVGSTDRCALKVQNPIYGICSQGVTGVNSDVIMILHLDWTTSKISVLSIPRDTFIPNARSTGPNKIDAALSEGPTQLVKAIQEDFGIPIQHFVELNFETFAGVVDALGGLNMYFPMPVYDAYSQLHQLTPGCVKLNGTEALAVVRARHLQYQSSPANGSNPSNWPQENLSDLARIRRDHEFLRVLADQVKNQGLGNPITDAKLVNAIAPQLTVDQGFSTSHMIAMIGQFQGTDAYRTPQYTLPVMTSSSFSYIYQGYNYGNVTFPINGEGLATIWAFLSVRPMTNTMTGQPLPTPSATSVSILDQSGISNAGETASTAMKAIGYNVTSVTQGTPPANPAETVVAYNSLDPSVIAQAQMVLRGMKGQTIMAYEPNLTSPVTLMLGSTYSIYPPDVFLPWMAAINGAKSTTTTVKAPSTTTTTTPSTTTTIPGFSAPNSSTTKLAPWDPRSCNKSGGAGP